MAKFYVSTVVKGVIVTEIETDTKEHALELARQVDVYFEESTPDEVIDGSLLIGFKYPKLIHDEPDLELELDLMDVAKEELKKLG